MALPTPKYDLNSFPDVYQPAEDTHLFLDALEKDASNLIKIKPLFSCEIGCGSGILITALSTILKNSNFCFSTDVNLQACYATKQTAKLNNVDVEVTAMDLLSAFRCRFDIILFNPPYVISEINELEGYGLNRAYAGGPKGRRIIDSFLRNLHNYLTPNGICYLLLLKDNGIKEIEELFNQMGYQYIVILERRIPGEYLYVYKIFNNE